MHGRNIDEALLLLTWEGIYDSARSFSNHDGAPKTKERAGGALSLQRLDSWWAGHPAGRFPPTAEFETRQTFESDPLRCQRWVPLLWHILQCWNRQRGRRALGRLLNRWATKNAETKRDRGHHVPWLTSRCRQVGASASGMSLPALMSPAFHQLLPPPFPLFHLLIARVK